MAPEELAAQRELRAVGQSPSAIAAEQITAAKRMSIPLVSPKPAG